MSAISFNAPYAPQPVPASHGDTGFAGPQANQQVAQSSSSGGANLASDHSGQGAGSGTGTGGAHLAALLKRGRVAMPPVEAAPKSVIEAQARESTSADFLARQEQLQIESKALQEARDSEQAAARAKAAAEAAAEAAEPEPDLPNPLPTAPILERDEA